mgnify:CR=1 FL=1
MNSKIISRNYTAYQFCPLKSMVCIAVEVKPKALTYLPTCTVWTLLKSVFLVYGNKLLCEIFNLHQAVYYEVIYIRVFNECLHPYIVQWPKRFIRLSQSTGKNSTAIDKWWTGKRYVQLIWLFILFQKKEK